jgi:transcription initiation factor IIE alpha subunit
MTAFKQITFFTYKTILKMTNEQKILTILFNHKSSSIEGLEISTGLKKYAILRAAVRLRKQNLIKFVKGRTFKDQYGFPQFDKKYRGLKLIKTKMYLQTELFI